jgi:transcriptional regulator GlxA family with amidase domain
MGHHACMERLVRPAATEAAAGRVARPVPALPVVDPFRRVVVLVDHGVSAFEFAIPCEVFGLDRADAGLEFDFKVASPVPGPVRASAGFDITAHHGLAALADAELIVVPAFGLDYRVSPELARALNEAVDRGATVMSLCSGAFVLAEAGLLRGRRATTHWQYTDLMRTEHPDVELIPDVLYVHDGPVLTCAGTAAGIDGSLYLIRAAFGSQAAVAVARRMVVPPQRDGGQAQYVATPVRPVTADSLAPVLDWALAHLGEPLDVARLARRASMSDRTFARRFRQETGTTPHQWLVRQRVAMADALLERGGLSVEQVARTCGFGSAAVLRQHFVRIRGTTPTNYRRAFAPPHPAR